MPRCVYTAHQVPLGWRLVSSDLLAKLDPNKQHPPGTTHWYRPGRRAVVCKKYHGRWVMQEPSST